MTPTSSDLAVSSLTALQLARGQVTPSDGAVPHPWVLSAAPSAPYANTSRRYLAGLRRTHTRVTRTMRQSSSDVVLTEPSGRVTT